MYDLGKAVDAFEGDGELTLERLFIAFSLVANHRYHSAPVILSFKRDDGDMTAGEIKLKLGQKEFSVSQGSGNYFVKMGANGYDCSVILGYYELFDGLNDFFDKAEKLAFSD